MEDSNGIYLIGSLTQTTKMLKLQSQQAWTSAQEQRKRIRRSFRWSQLVCGSAKIIEGLFSKKKYWRSCLASSRWWRCPSPLMCALTWANLPARDRVRWSAALGLNHWPCSHGELDRNESTFPTTFVKAFLIENGKRKHHVKCVLFFEGTRGAEMRIIRGALLARAYFKPYRIKYFDSS